MATETGGDPGAYRSWEIGSSRKTPQKVRSQAMVSGRLSTGSTAENQARTLPTPWVRAASWSDPDSCDTDPTRTRALVGRLEAAYAITSSVVVWYRSIPSLE